MRRVSLLLASVLLVLFVAQTASANIMFSDEFTGSPSTYWTNTSVATYTSNNATFALPAPDYVRTVDTNYGTADFVASIKLTNGDVTNSGVGIVRLGLGTGTNTGEYAEPPTGNLYFSYYGGGFDPKLGGVNIGNGVVTSFTSLANRSAGTTIGVQLAWTAATHTAVFKIDGNNDGVFSNDGVNDQNLTYSDWDPSSYGTGTRLFFGGASGICDTFSVVSTVPEPGTIILLGTSLLGLLAYAWRKRR